MKILQITYGLSSGGAERFLVDLMNEMCKKKDVEITLLMIKSDNSDNNTFYLKELNGKVHVKSLGMERLDSSIFLRLYKYIKKYEPDIVHIHLSPIILYCILPLMFYRKPVYIETIHNEVARIDNGSKIKRILKYFVYQLKQTHICTISDKNAREFKRVYGKKCDIMIYNGRKFNGPSADFDKAKQEIESYKWNNDTIVVTHIARCSPQKNQDLLIDGFNQLLAEEQNVILLVIGNGFNSEKGLQLQQKASKGIYFLGEKHNVQDYLLSSDAFCLSSRYEGMPITLIEALACGCIPMSTPVSGVTDLIEDGVNGFISTGFSESSYMDMLHHFISQHSNINKQDLRDLYKKKLSIEACATSYYDFYKSAINAHTKK